MINEIPLIMSDLEQSRVLQDVAETVNTLNELAYIPSVNYELQQN